MKSEAVNLLRFFQIGKQCLIPIYQRTYSWTEEQCDLLWNDIIRVGTNDKIPNHFVGSFVYIQDNPSQVLTATPLCMVIDGQQRMTTISLLLLALANAIEKKGGELQLNEEFKVSSNYIKNNYLLNSNEDGDRRFKLILTQSDRDTYLNLLQAVPLPTEASKRIVENYEFFEDKLSDVNLKDVYVGIQKLMIVEIALDRSTDNPQLIFESLNSTGLELSQADLIRNFILMGLESERQKRIYNEFWFPMERRFGHAEYSSYFDRFMRDYLTIKLGRIPNIQDVHREFKFHSQSDDTKQIEDIVAEIYKYSEYFVNMVLNKEPNAFLKKMFESISDLKVDVAYPLLLEVYSDYKVGVITQQEFVEILQMLESYVFRRAICGIPTNSMNKTFATLYKEVDKENYLESFKAALLVKDSYRRFPSNDEFMRELMTKNIYKSRNTNYLLSKLENSRSSKESINLGQFSIEHILPQNLNLSEQWQSDLGENWKEIQEKYLHTLGNLTLTGYNTELSDRPFAEKRDMKGGFKDSRLFLNSQLDGLTKWTEGDINHRAEQLATIARDIWSIPALDESILQKYRKVKETKRTPSAYTLDDYKHMTGFRLELFSRLKENILEIDSAITEQCNKYYIAFRTADESNFVAIVAQKSRLRITLNIDNENLKDPKGICSNVEDLGYWGGGQRSLFGLTEEGDIDYAIELIKQSFDYVSNE